MYVLRTLAEGQYRYWRVDGVWVDSLEDAFNFRTAAAPNALLPMVALESQVDPERITVVGLVR